MVFYSTGYIKKSIWFIKNCTNIIYVFIISLETSDNEWHIAEKDIFR